MAWEIQHAGSYSEEAVTDWSAELRLVMPEWDWQTVAPLFDCAGAFTIPAAEAGRMAERLVDAACSTAMYPLHRRMTEDIAKAAKKASKSGRPWRWI
jgi:hypothetical protein